MSSGALRGASAHSTRGRPGKVTLALLAAVAATPFLSAAAQAQPESSALANPPANIPRTAAMDQACSSGPGQQCQDAVVEAIDQARAAEGVGPLELPSYYDSLSSAEQLMVLTDLERVSRGLPGFVGMSSQLDVLATQAASANADPDGPNGDSWGSNWAGGEASALLADYDWMYDDGFGSPNLDCTSAPASGCWDHRENILGSYGAHPSIGTAATRVNGVTSMTELLSSGAAGRLDYVMPAKDPGLVSPSSLEIGTTPAVPNTAMLTVSDGTGSFRVQAQVAGDKGHWSVTPSCNAPAGRKCHLFVTFAPAQSGRANATVTLDLGDHTDQVGVSAFTGHGYWEATSDGRITAYAGGGFRGSAGAIHLARPVVGMVASPDGGGYWEVAADGGVFSFGDARFFGSAADLRSKEPVVGMAPSADGHGYWLVTDNGGVYSFGDAKFYGTPAGRAGNHVVGIAAAPGGRGYWMVTGTGSVYSFGGARYFGPRTPLPLAQPVVGMAVTHDGGGYWLVTKSGHVYSFGDAGNFGSLRTTASNDVVGMAVPAMGPGYYVVAANGEVFSFGGAPVARSAVTTSYGNPVVAMATA